MTPDLISTKKLANKVRICPRWNMLAAQEKRAQESLEVDRGRGKKTHTRRRIKENSKRSDKLVRAKRAQALLRAEETLLEDQGWA